MCPCAFLAGSVSKTLRFSKRGNAATSPPCAKKLQFFHSVVVWHFSAQPAQNLRFALCHCNMQRFLSNCNFWDATFLLLPPRQRRWHQCAPSYFHYFLCHHKAHAAAQARYLKILLQKRLGNAQVLWQANDTFNVGG